MHKATLDYAKQQDEFDELSNYRNQFHIPKNKKGNELIYMTGNSLGASTKTNKSIHRSRTRRLG